MESGPSVGLILNLTAAMFWFAALVSLVRTPEHFFRHAPGTRGLWIALLVIPWLLGRLLPVTFGLLVGLAAAGYFVAAQPKITAAKVATQQRRAETYRKIADDAAGWGRDSQPPEGPSS
jgi:hypothetical protein